MESPIIILCGIPGTGKSTFGDWMAKTKGWLHLDMENADLKQYKLNDPWMTFLNDQHSTLFVDCLEAQGIPVVLDWGFPITLLGIISSLKAQGAMPWWFTGKRHHARASYLTREKKKSGCDPRLFDCQYAAIANNWFQIAPIFDTRVIRSIDSEGKFLSCEDIYHLITETDDCRDEAGRINGKIIP